MHCKCGSYAINHHHHGRDGSDPELCDVCYWRKRAQPAPGAEWTAAEMARQFSSNEFGEFVQKDIPAKQLVACDSGECPNCEAGNPGAEPATDFVPVRRGLLEGLLNIARTGTMSLGTVREAERTLARET